MGVAAPGAAVGVEAEQVDAVVHPLREEHLKNSVPLTFVSPISFLEACSPGVRRLFVGGLQGLHELAAAVPHRLRELPAFGSRDRLAIGEHPGNAEPIPNTIVISTL